VAETNERSERGAQRYRASWGAPATQRLFARLPTWLILDDHEFGDNVDGASNAEVDSVEGRDFHTGFNAAVAYQARYHRPVPRLRRDGQRWRVDRGFWHAFEIGGIPAFAMDTRTERETRDLAGWRSARLIGDEQLHALKSWLVEHRDSPKLVCSGSVFGVTEARHVQAPTACIDDDSWCGYPRTWRELVRFIVEEDLQHIVFLSGDYHLSLMAELELRSEGRSVRALSLACSGWNASLPFANAQARDFDPGQPVLQPWSDRQASIVSTTGIASTALRQFSKVSLHHGADEQGLRVEMRTYAGEEGRVVGPPMVGRLQGRERVSSVTP
jgi:cholesterol oxidase